MNYFGLMHRFNGEDLLQKFRGKSFMFVGDSLSNNQWQSLACMLHAAVPNSNYTFDRTRNRSVLSFPVSQLFDRLKFMTEKSIVSFSCYDESFQNFPCAEGLAKTTFPSSQGRLRLRTHYPPQTPLVVIYWVCCCCCKC